MPSWLAQPADGFGASFFFVHVQEMLPAPPLPAQVLKLHRQQQQQAQQSQAHKAKREPQPWQAAQQAQQSPWQQLWLQAPVATDGSAASHSSSKSRANNGSPSKQTSGASPPCCSGGSKSRSSGSFDVMRARGQHAPPGTTGAHPAAGSSPQSSPAAGPPSLSPQRIGAAKSTAAPGSGAAAGSTLTHQLAHHQAQQAWLPSVCEVSGSGISTSEAMHTANAAHNAGITHRTVGTLGAISGGLSSSTHGSSALSSCAWAPSSLDTVPGSSLDTVPGSPVEATTAAAAAATAATATAADVAPTPAMSGPVTLPDLQAWSVAMSAGGHDESLS